MMNCRYIAFDVDGTLLDTLTAALVTLRQTLEEFTGRSYPMEQLDQTMGRSNEDALALWGALEDAVPADYRLKDPMSILEIG